MKQMIFILMLALMFNTSLLASSDKKETIADKEVQKQIEREKKYAKEQTFYQGKKYDLKSFEVNSDSLDSMPEMEVDYSDGDDVLDME